MSNLTKGILLTLLAALFLTAMNLMFKLAGPNISSYEKLFARGITLALVGYWLVKKEAKKDPTITLLGKSQNRKLLFARSFCGSIGSLLFIYCLNYLTLADVDMMQKLNVIFLILLSSIFLKEKTTIYHYAISFICIIGLVLIIKPTFNNPNIVPYLVGVLGIFLIAFAYLCIRYLTNKKDSERPSTIIFNLAIFMLISMAYPTWKNFKGFDGYELAYLYLALSSILSALGQLCLTYSYKFAPSKEISVYSYSSLIYSFLFGYFCFGVIPDIYSFIGYVIIVGSGIALFLYNKRFNRKQAINNKA